MGTWSEFMPLGGKHIKDKSGKKNVTLKKSVSGKSVLGSLGGASYQKQLSGKNLCPLGTKEITTSNGYYTYTLDKPIPAGTYTVSLMVTSTDTASSKSLFTLIDDDNNNTHVTCARDTRVSYTVTLSTDITRIRLCSSGSTSGSAGDTSIWTDIQIEAGDKMTDFEEYCGGTASPNPSYPQTIHSTGDSGWFDGEWLQGYYSINTGAYGTSSDAICSKNPIPCKSGDVIKVVTETIFDAIHIMYYGENGYLSHSSVTNAKEHEFTLPSGATNFNIRIDRTNITPSTVGHVCVTINGQYAVIVDEVGKNWLEYDRPTNTTKNGVDIVYNDDGSITLNGTCTAWFFVNLNYRAGARNLPNGKYVLTGGTNNALLTASKDGSSIGSDRGTGLSFELTEKTTSDYIRFEVLSGSVLSNVTIYPMLRKCDSNGNPIGNDTFTPYQHKRTYIPISEPLRAVNDVKDEICVQNGEYGALRRIKRVILDGSGDWRENNPNTKSYSYYGLTDIGGNTDTYAVSNLLCNQLISRPQSRIYDGTYSNAICTLGEGFYRIYVRFDETITSVDLLKAKLAESPITVDYELATPVFEPFADQTPFYNLLSYDEVTNVSIVGLHENVEPTLQMFYPSSEDGVNVLSLFGNNSQLRFNDETGTIQVIDTDGDWVDIYVTDSIPIIAWDGSVLGNTLKFPASKWSIVNYTASGETSGGATLELSTQYLKLDRGSGVNYQSVLYLPVNVTNCKTLHITGHSVRLGSYYNVGDAWIQKVVPDGSKLNGGAGDIQSCRWNTGTAWIDPTSFTLDVSDLTGIYYICISNAGYEGYTEITELYFDLL